MKMDSVTLKSREVIGYLRSTMMSIGSVLSGNPLSGEYDIKSHIASAGPDLLWRIYDATKKSTKEEVSVFLLDKGQLNSLPREEKNSIVKVLRDGIFQMTRLRHPSVLTIHHPLEESKDFLAFATEPVFASLANVLMQWKNFPVPAPSNFSEFKLNDIDIKYGILKVAEALSFLHNTVRVVHRDVCPENIIINKNGFWKLSGFEYAASAINPKDQDIIYPFIDLRDDIPSLLQPNLDYAAPEYASQNPCSPAGDMFSLGLMIFFIYANGRKLMSTARNVEVWKKSVAKFSDLPRSTFSGIPNEAKDIIDPLTNADPSERPDAYQLTKFEYFNDMRVKTVQYLDSIFQRDNLQKTHFYRDLLSIIPQLPKRIATQKVLPCLVKEFHNPPMIPCVLPGVMLVAEQMSGKEFMSSLFPELIPVLRYKEPMQIIVIFLNHINLLVSKSTPEAVCNHVLPMIYYALECGQQGVQDLCLSVVPRFAHLVEYATTKNALLPRIKSLCLRTTYLSVRVNALVCIGHLLEHLDKWLVMDDILPFLTLIPSKEPGVVMAILGIVKLTLDHKKLGITPELMASRIIPFLMPLAIESELEVRQFDTLMYIVKDMIEKVETEQRSKLERLSRLRKEQASSSKEELGDESNAESCDDFKEVDLGLERGGRPFLADWQTPQLAARQTTPGGSSLQIDDLIESNLSTLQGMSPQGNFKKETTDKPLSKFSLSSGSFDLAASGLLGSPSCRQELQPAPFGKPAIQPESPSLNCLISSLGTLQKPSTAPLESQTAQTDLNDFIG